MGKGEAEEDVATAAASPVELLRERRRRADGAGDGTASGGASSALRHQVGGGGDGVPVSGVDVAPHKGLQAAEKVAVAVISTALPGPRAGAGSTAGGLPRPGGGCCVDNDDGEGPSAAEDSISPSQHTRILLQKNLKLKQQQYFSFTRVVCLPAPFAILVEFMLPLACILALTWVKTLTDIIVHPQGWGGDVPQNQLDPSTPCVAGIDYHWERATAPDEDRTTSCRPYLEVLRQPQDFWRVLAQLHALPQVKLALAADRLEDVAKVRTMRRWIDTNWYPRTYLNDVPCFGGELIAGDIGWDKEAMSGANRFRNCSHHGVNPGEISGFEDITVMVGDGTSEALQQYITGPDYEHDGRPRIWAAVEFDRIPGGGRPGEHSGDWEYSIRLNITHADTRSMQIGSPTRKHMWSTEYYSTLYGFAGHMSLQLLVDRYIIGRRAADTPAASVLESHNFQKFHVDARYEVDLVQTLSPAQLEVLAEPMRYEPQIVQLLPMPEDGWRKADFYRVVKSVFALVFMLLYMYSVFNIIASLVEEKETRVRELLRMMSVGNTALLASWYLTYAAVFGVLNFVIVVACKMPGGMFEYSDYSVLFVFFSLFSVSAISYAYMVHTFFDKAKTGGVVGMLMFFSMYFCYTAFRSDDTPASIKQAISYFAPCSFAYGVDQLVSREEISEGMHWSNMQEPLEGRWSGVSFAQILRKLLIDAVIYSLLGFYLDQVLPKEFGMRRSPWFPIEQIFPSGKRRVQVGAVDTGTPETATKGDNFEAVNLPNTQQLESENRCVLIDGLRKTFDTPDGEKVAVQGLTLRMYAGQIFVLLGHNGAGKTTTINMLTGLYQPTSGDARVFGKSIVAEMPAVRRRISVCPQHDVLFLTLTVFENLEFFAALRGVPATARDAQVLKKIGQVGLTEKTHAKAGSLSGGMKRKLSLAIALIGDTGAVFLDEPTSGMDPYSRRSTWNTLQSEKAGRVMILTTHFMEEADLLGDRIGVMAEGELRCCGSPLFLKRRFGSGYTLVITRKSSCVLRALQDVVLQIVPSATLMSAVGTEVMFQLPMDAVSSFPALLDTLGTEQLGVEQFGISITTMEEVFCKIASGESQANNDAMLHDVSERQETEPHAGSDAAAAGAVSPPSSMFIQHVHAMFTKRCQYGHRDRVAILCTTVLPVIMLLVGLVLLKYGESGGIFANQVSTPMNLDKCTDQAVTPVPFIVGSDRSDAHPAVSAKVEARLSQMPGSMPEKMPYSGATAEGSQHLWGVNYEAGIPECGYAYHPRSDVPWTDRRFNYIGWPLELMDPELIVGFAQSVLTAGAGSDDAVAYGALIFHDELDQRPVDICSIPAVVSEPHSAVVSGNSDGAKCSVSIRAPPGQTVHLKILRNTLRTNTVSLYNATQPLPTNLMAVLSVNSTDQIVRSSTGTITIVENQEHPISTAGCAGCEEWSVLWSFQDACADSNEQCPVIVDQVASLGFDCHSTLGDINIDTIPFPPVDVRTGEPIVLPRNPVTGKEVTEPEFRLLAHQYMPRLIRQYGDNTLAEFCPVSCVDEVCINDRNNNCVRKNQCEQQGQASCHYSSSAIKPPQFACSTEELQTVATTCGNGWRDTGFCKSRCFGQLKPWLVHCEQQRQAAMAGLSWTSWGVLNAAMGLAPNCDARPFVSSDTSSSSSNPQVGVTIMVNSSAYHAAPTYMNIASNVLRKGPLHHDVDDHTQTAGASIIMNSYPLPFTQKQSALLDSIKALQAVLFIMIAFAFVPGGIVVYVVREKEQHHNSKHQQMISGASIPSFWLASFAYDVLVYCLPLCLSLLAILWVDLRALIEDGAFFACFMLLLGYGLAITSFTYCCSFLFDKHTKAQIVTVLFNVFLGMVLMVAQFIMAQIDATQPMNESLMPVYRLSPGFCLGHGLLTLTTSNLLTTYLGQSVIYEPLSAEIAGTDVLYLFVLTVIYLLLAIAIEYARSKPKIAAWFAPRSLRAVEDAPYSVDEDVQAEADRIERSAPGSADELIRLVNLRKVYRGSFRSAPKVAVRNMSFGVNTGECFGYLGINGAGKTTTMKILTGELLATSGQAYLGGLDITEHQQRVRHLIGYCPQFDALLDKLTTLEHLQLFGRLKGLQGPALEEAIAGILRMLGLTNFTNKLAGTLSGGNKRKLSVGIALIGRPRVIFLDEPSTGVDPVARRFMWGVISTVCKDPVHPCCVVLTSHVMEEIEALCTRVGVVVGGRLRCLGSNQHLKARFGRGYCLELKLKRPAAAAVAAVLRDPCLAARAGAPVLGGELGAVCAALGRGARAALVSPEDEGGWVIHEALQREGCVALPELARWWLGEDAVEQLDAFIQQRCPAARRIERQGSMLSYLVGDGVGAPELFRVAEATRHECGVEEYGVAQDTLEHIFNSFAAQQQEEGGSVRGMATPDRDGASAAGPSHNEVEHGSDPTCTSTANPVASNPSDGQAVLVAEDL